MYVDRKSKLFKFFKGVKYLNNISKEFNSIFGILMYTNGISMYLIMFHWYFKILKYGSISINDVSIYFNMFYIYNIKTTSPPVFFFLVLSLVSLNLSFIYKEF
jgi:hypothetical protein